MISRTVKIYTAEPITLRDLIEFIEEAKLITDSNLDTVVRITQAPKTIHPTDPGGEVTISVST